jgi:nucleotide-binding universal stress UspA family protein
MITIKKILCPVDFSEPSQEALIIARELAVTYDAEVRLLHVIPFPAPNPRGLASEEEAEAFARREVEVKLREIQQGGESFLVRVGDAAGQIISTAKAEDIDVIVMSTHGLTGWRRFVLGSVTEQVLQSAPCPVLSVRHNAELEDQNSDEGADMGEAVTSPVLNGLTIKRILCPTDFSEPSYAALEAAGTLAAKFNAELCVLNVLEPLEPVLGIVSKEEFDTARSADVAGQIRRAIKAHVAADVASRAVVEIGDPAAGILDAATKENAELIVIATNGATGWRHLVFGSVAAAVLHHASQLVLTVHAPADLQPPLQTSRATNPATASEKLKAKS